MCGRTTLTVSRYALAQALDVSEVDAPELAKSWNVAPTQDIYGVVATGDGGRVLRSFRWGLVPAWADNPRTGNLLINARSETLAQRPAFRGALQYRRCLLPVSGFYEWQRSSGGRRYKPQAYYFSRADDELLVLAGLYEAWDDGEGRVLHSCAIVTTAANSTMKPVHHRMPVVLAPGDWEEWLSRRPLNDRRLEALLVPAADELLQCWAVGPGVNRASIDEPALAERVDLPGPGAAPLTLFDERAELL